MTQRLPSAQPDVLQPVSPLRRLASRRLWLPLLLQTALILAIPAHDAYTWITGKPITLQTVPVDPYDMLRGYSQALRYDISAPATLQTLPGGDWFAQHQGDRFYVVLQAPAQPQATPPQPWQPIRISTDRPTQLPANQIALQGQYDGTTLTYGLETYYFPEDQRDRLTQDINAARLNNRQALVVDVKVDSTGHAIPVRLWVRDRHYQF